MAKQQKPVYVGKRAGKKILKDSVFSLRQEVLKLTSEVATLSLMFNDMALLVDKYLPIPADNPE